MCIFFFFFQAEDGIRDLTVTGVQTCALPIYAFLARVSEHLADERRQRRTVENHGGALPCDGRRRSLAGRGPLFAERDRKSTRLNSSHSQISYAVFCLKKKNKKHKLHSPCNNG